MSESLRVHIARKGILSGPLCGHEPGIIPETIVPWSRRAEANCPRCHVLAQQDPRRSAPEPTHQE